MTQFQVSDMFAGIPISDYTTALAWYKQLLGFPPAFFPHETEAVWQLAEHRYLYIVQQPEHAGHAVLMLFVADLDALIAQIRARGIEPAKQETFAKDVRKITYRDVDGNEISWGGATNDQLILRPSKSVRADWPAQFERMAAQGDDTLLDDGGPSTDWNERE